MTDIDRRCPICEGRNRETTGMVCQTCGRDYGSTAGELRDRLAAIWRLHRPIEGRCVECVEYCDCFDTADKDADYYVVYANCPHGNEPWPCPTAKAGGFA